MLRELLATLRHGPDTGLRAIATPFVAREDYVRPVTPGALLDTGPDLVANERAADPGYSGVERPSPARPAIFRIAVPGLRGPWSLSADDPEALGIPHRMMAHRRQIGGGRAGIIYADPFTESVTVAAPQINEGGVGAVYIGSSAEVIRGASKLGA